MSMERGREGERERGREGERERGREEQIYADPHPIYSFIHLFIYLSIV